MADLKDFFENYLPNKLNDNPELITDINSCYQFDLEGFGTWTVDLTTEGGNVAEGAPENPDCIVTCAASDFEGLVDNPASGMMLFMSGKLQVSNVALAMSLQKLLS